MFRSKQLWLSLANSFYSAVRNRARCLTTCPTAVTECHGGSYIGIQVWTYQAVITLPGPCADWQMGHGEPARNAAIAAIVGNGTDNLCVFSTIDNTNGLCNSSTVFTNPPVPFACVGQRFVLTMVITMLMAIH
ncbi:MAG: hypothetical protein IPP27_08320 [Bacteroidetes bacterium]|nr:hypothetical protein [Bacteroidota bacterium]